MKKVVETVEYDSGGNVVRRTVVTETTYPEYGPTQVFNPNEGMVAANAVPLAIASPGLVTSGGMIRTKGSTAIVMPSGDELSVTYANN